MSVFGFEEAFMQQPSTFLFVLWPKILLVYYILVVTPNSLYLSEKFVGWSLWILTIINQKLLVIRVQCRNVRFYDLTL